MFGYVLDVLFAKLFDLKMLGKIDNVVALDVVGYDDDCFLVLKHLVHLDDLLDASACIQSGDLSFNVYQVAVLRLSFLLEDF